MPVSHRPGECRADSLAEPTGNCGLRRPDRRQNGEHVGPRDAVNSRVTEGGESVHLEGPLPDGRGSPISPAGSVRLDGAFRSLSEGRDGLRPLPLGQWVPTVSDRSPITRRPLAGLGEAHGGESPQPDVPPPSVYHDSLYPGLRAAPRYGQIQPVAVAVSSRIAQALHLHRRQLRHVLFPTCFPT